VLVRAVPRVVGRLAERLFAAVFFFGRVDLALRLALRLAIVRCPFEP
jgi:hypothetical protein